MGPISLEKHEIDILDMFNSIQGIPSPPPIPIPTPASTPIDQFVDLLDLLSLIHIGRDAYPDHCKWDQFGIHLNKY